jgi:non-heme chloroperoxidase
MLLNRKAAARLLRRRCGVGSALRRRPLRPVSRWQVPYRRSHNNGDQNMQTVKTSDGVELFYKDWGPKNAQPIVFHHGWPLSSDDWDAQMLFFISKGYRVVAHDRRGHGRSTQVLEDGPNG